LAHHRVQMVERLLRLLRECLRVLDHERPGA
jgi:hypothetical protein